MSKSHLTRFSVPLHLDPFKTTKAQSHLALLLRGAVNHEPLTAPPGEAKLVEAEQHQAQQERERSLE